MSDNGLVLFQEKAMNGLKNSPVVKIGIVAVSRDCFPIELSRERLKHLLSACDGIEPDIFACRTIIENEHDSMLALQELAAAKCNAAVIYLGNFGPEGPLSIFAKKFDGPVMVCAAAEESGNNLINGRGDAF